MAKKPTNTAEPSAERTAAPAKGVKVTYRTKDGPIETTCWGIKFEVNVPVTIDPKRTVPQLMPTQVVLPDGSTQTRHTERDVPVIDLAKNNPDFEVEGFPRAKRRTSTRVVPPPGAEWTKAHEGEIDEAAA